MRTIQRQSIQALTYEQQTELADIAIRVQLNLSVTEDERKIWDAFMDNA